MIKPLLLIIELIPLMGPAIFDALPIFITELITLALIGESFMSLTTSKGESGLFVPIPIRLFRASIDSVFASKLSASTTLARVQVEDPPVVKFNAPNELIVPDVAARFKTPVVWVKPLLAVSTPAEVIAPVPVVVISVEVVLPLPVTLAKLSASAVRKPVIAVLVTPVTLPSASVVITGINVLLP